MTRPERPKVKVTVVLGSVMVLLLVGCGGEDQPSPATPVESNSTTAETSPPSLGASEIFTSLRHGYTVAVPPDWQVSEYEGTWTDLDQFSPGAEVPGEDVVAPADRSAFLVMNSMEIPTDTSPQEWWSTFDAIIASELATDCEVTTADGVVAGQPATVVEQTCDDAIIRGHSLVYGDRGYYFTTRVPVDDAEALKLINELTESIEFTS